MNTPEFDGWKLALELKAEAIYDNPKNLNKLMTRRVKDTLGNYVEAMDIAKRTVALLCDNGLFDQAIILIDDAIQHFADQGAQAAEVYRGLEKDKGAMLLKRTFTGMERQCVKFLRILRRDVRMRVKERA